MKNRTFKYQLHQKTSNPIEQLKNRLADNDLSILDFYLRYYVKCSKETYPEFLDVMNNKGVQSDELKKAMADFWIESK